MVMHLRTSAPNWESISGAKDAKCLKFPGNREHDPWFEDMDESAQICNGDNDGVICPIRHECLLFALVNNEHQGVWGGTQPLQRHWLRKKYKHKNHRPRPEWKFENAPPNEELVAKEQARQAERKARRLGGDEEEPDAAAG